MRFISLGLCALALSCALPVSALYAQTKKQVGSPNTIKHLGEPRVIYQLSEGWQGNSSKDDLAYAQGVSGHAILGLSGGEYVMVGGCNFPDRPAAEGGAKQFYDHIYLSNAQPSLADKTKAEESQPVRQWIRIGSLPQPVAYAGHAVYQGELILVGGQSTGGIELDAVYSISRDRNRRVLLQSLPPLPAPRSSMACAIVGTKLYVVGGSERGRLTNSVLSLDLEHLEDGWLEETPYPGSPRLKVLATSAHNAGGDRNLYAWGVFSHSEGEQGVSEDAFFARLDPKTNKWVHVPMPSECLRDGASFGGGLMLSLNPRYITLAGGVQTPHFLPALARGQGMRRAKRLRDSDWLAKLNTEAKTYLLHPPSWYRFGATTLRFDTKTGLWSKLSTPSLLVERADASFSNGWVFGGELKPGIRTPLITAFHP